LIKDFIDLVSKINISITNGDVYFVLYKSVSERELKLEEIKDNLDIIYSLESSIIDFDSINPIEYFLNCSKTSGKGIFHLINLEAHLNSFPEVVQILESKREKIVTPQRIFLFWLTEAEIKLLSEQAPNFFSFGRANIYEVEDKSILTKEQLAKMINDFEKKYQLTSDKLLKGEYPAEYDEYEIKFWKFLLSLNIK
jgi:hypothetical protein